MRLAGSLCLVALFVGCSSGPTPEQQASRAAAKAEWDKAQQAVVTTINPAQVAGCTSKGVVTGKDYKTGMYGSPEGTPEGATESAKADAYKKGANRLLLGAATTTTEDWGKNGNHLPVQVYSQTAEAYACPDVPATK